MGESTLESEFRNLRGTLLRVTDLNGIVGYGFVNDSSGFDQVYVSWPDKQPTRYTQESASRHGLVIEEAFPTLIDETNDELHEVNSSLSEENANDLLVENDHANDELNSSVSSVGQPEEIALASTKIPGLKFLIGAGLNTIGDVKKYIDENGDLEPIKGIGEKLNAEILDFLAELDSQPTESLTGDSGSSLE